MSYFRQFRQLAECGYIEYNRLHKRDEAQTERRIEMKYICNVCGYVYDETTGDPDNGIAAGTKWEDVPEDFVCPLCGVGKDEFSAED